MQIIGENEVDILIDANGQPVADGNGDMALVSGMSAGFRILRMKH